MINGCRKETVPIKNRNEILRKRNVKRNSKATGALPRPNPALTRDMKISETGVKVAVWAPTTYSFHCTSSGG